MADEQPGENTNPLAFMVWINAVLLIVLEMPALSVTVFLRRNFGCRFMKLWMIALDALALWTLFSVQAAFTVGGGFISFTPARAFALVMVVFALYHSRTAWKRFWGQAKDPSLTTHSLSDGESLLAPFIPMEDRLERIRRMVAEPSVMLAASIVCYVLGFVWSGGFFPIGVWFMIAAVFHTLYEALLYELRLNAYIDSIDKIIVAEAVSMSQEQFLSGRTAVSPREVMGAPVVLDSRIFDVMAAARKLRKQRPDAAA